MSTPTLQPPSIPHNLSDESQTPTIIAPPLPLNLSHPASSHDDQAQDQIDLKQPLRMILDNKINAEPSPRSSVEREKVEVKRRALEPVMEGPKYNIRILLMSGQSKTFSFPPHTSVGVVKELVWGEWPGDWNPDPGRPPAPNYFRILFMGRMLADPEILSGLNLKAAPASTIVHLSLRTFPPAPEEPPKKSILPFSLPTLPRPSGLSSRQNSSNVQTTVAPGSGTGGSAFVPSSARANDHGAQASTVTGGGGGGPNGQSAGAGAGTGGSARPVTYNGGEEHGGGCKCVIQ